MTKTFRVLLLGTSSLAFSVAVAARASAQEVLETVIVTAEKQASDIQKTAIAITAISPEVQAGDGNTLVQDMLRVVPSINVLTNFAGQQGVSQTYYTRGIGTSTGEATVATLDGIYAPSGFLDQFAYFDVSRIEVLRGPQGTLYGRNAEAGAINLYTNDPTQQYAAKVFVEGGSFNEVSSQAMVNIPLSDDLALRVTTGSIQRTGFVVPSGAGDQDSESVRGKLLYKPTEDFSILLTGAFSNANSTTSTDVIPQKIQIANFASPAFGGFNPCGGKPASPFSDPWHSPATRYGAFPCTVPAQPPVNPAPVTGVCQRVGRAEADIYSVGTQINYDLGFGEFYFAATQEGYKSPLGPLTGGGFTNEAPNTVWSNPNYSIVEARISNPASQTWKWLGGVYWENDTSFGQTYSRTAVTGACAPVGCVTVTNAPNGVSAVFGQTTVPITDAFRIIGGLRYSRDWRDTTGYVFNITTDAQNGARSRNSFQWPTLTWKAGAEFDVAPNNMIYTTAATGFRQGGSFTDTFCIDNTTKAIDAPLSAATGGGCPAGSTVTGRVAAINPDKTISYEIGSKNRFLDNRLQVDVDAFDEKLSDFFVSAFGLNHANQSVSIYSDIKGASVYGSELDASILLTSNDRIDFGLTYLRSRINEVDNPYDVPVCYNYGVASHPQIADLVNTTNAAACAAKNLAANPATVNWVRYRPALTASDPLPHAPTWAGEISYSHIFDLSSGANVTAKINVHFEGATNTNVQNFYDGVNPAYHMTNLSLAYGTADGKWTLSAWVKNLENRFVTTAVGAPSGSVYVYQFPGLPRTWGVNLTAKF